MPKFDKPDSPNVIWGVNALEEDLTKPDDSYIQTGWTQVKPPYEYENYSMNKLYQGFAYYNQLGIPEWDSVTEYQAGKSYVQGSNNRVYKCIQTHTNRNPSTSGNGDWWELFEGNRQATTSRRGTVEIATDSEEIEGLLKTVASTPGGIAEAFSGRSLLENNGHQELPNGLKINWGRVNVNVDSEVTVSFSLPFTTSVFIGLATPGSTTGVNPDSIYTTSRTLTSMRVGNTGDGGFFPAMWIAIGV